MREVAKVEEIQYTVIQIPIFTIIRLRLSQEEAEWVIKCKGYFQAEP
jgi:hypothetical protein